MFEEIVGASPPLRTVLSQVSKLAPTDSTVLITGETGTARSLSPGPSTSDRHAPPGLRRRECAAIPSSLSPPSCSATRGSVHRSPAATPGSLELADANIFLDESGAFAETQIMLLARPAGARIRACRWHRAIRVNVRLSAPT